MRDIEQAPGISPREYYSNQIQFLVELFNSEKLPNVANVHVEPKYGYVAQIVYHDASTRIVYGNDPGINPGSSGDLAKDKGYTKFILRNMGIDCPDGDEFLLPWWADKVRESPKQQLNLNIQTTNDVNDFIHNHLEYPVYIKPVDGSLGANIFKVHEVQELDDIFTLYSEQRVRVAAVEETIDMPDYRLTVLDGELINAYRRTHLSVVGNGVDNTERLLNNLQRLHETQGRETHIEEQLPRIIQHLGRTGLTLNYIPAPLEKVVLSPISNLSAGGNPIDVAADINRNWVDLAAKISKNFNLRLCGVDIACEDISSSDAAYSILEVNHRPGLHHYASFDEDQKKTVEDLYILIFNRT